MSDPVLITLILVAFFFICICLWNFFLFFLDEPLEINNLALFGGSEELGNLCGF